MTMEDEKMSGHPINQAIIAQLLFDLRNGQLRRALDMGFSEEDLTLLQDPEMLSVLVNSSVRWSTVSVNAEVMHRLLSRVKDSDKEIQMIDLMLKYGASSKLLAEAFGLDPREVALRKRVKGIDKKQGRWQEITEEQDHLLWREWQAKIQQYQLDKHDALDMAKVCMILSKKHGIQMAMIWQAMEKWIEMP